MIVAMNLTFKALNNVFARRTAANANTEAPCQITGAIQNFTKDLEVIESNFTVRTDGDPNQSTCNTTTSTFIKIRNKSEKVYNNPSLEILFFDTAGQLVDIADTQPGYSTVLPPQEDSYIKIVDCTAADTGRYSQHSVKLKWADIYNE